MSTIYKISISLILTCFIGHFQSTAKARQTCYGTYPVVLQFQSHCCGVPNDSLLHSFIKSFRKEQKIKKITAWHIGPMGREGEYYLAFSLKELNKKQAELFTREIKEVTQKLTDRGNAICEENMNLDKKSLPERATFTKVSF